MTMRARKIKDRQRRVREALPSWWNGKTLEEWAQILDCTPERAQQAIDNLIAKGLIVKAKEPSGEVDGPAVEAAARAVYGVIRDIKNPLGKTWAELTEAERQESYRLARAALEAGRDA